jgi:hypothetical protein
LGAFFCICFERYKRVQRGPNLSRTKFSLDSEWEKPAHLGRRELVHVNQN